MKNSRISRALGQIDEEWIAGAMKEKKRISWLKWVAAAACLCILAGAVLPSVLDRKPNKYFISAGEAGYIWPWEYSTNGERFSTVSFEGRTYISQNRTIDSSLLGEVLGQGKARGYDVYDEKTHTQVFEVRAVLGVSSEKIIAIGENQEYYVYRLDDKSAPGTLGKLMDLYGLEENLPLGRFRRGDKYYQQEESGEIWKILKACADAPLTQQNLEKEDHLSFTATSEALGVYKKAFCVYPSGYVYTNLLEYGYSYFIGEEAAGQIIDYAMSHCEKTVFEPYEQTIAGVLTQIGDGYVFIDNSVLCADPREGKVYRVYLNDLRASRHITAGRLKVGDTVQVVYEGVVSDSNEIFGAYDFQKGRVVDDGYWAIPE